MSTLLDWEFQMDQSRWRGFLKGKPQTTLFLLQLCEDRPDRCRLLGVAVPDEEERNNDRCSLQWAKNRAEMCLQEFVTDLMIRINLPEKPPGLSEAQGRLWQLLERHGKLVRTQPSPMYDRGPSGMIHRAYFPAPEYRDQIFGVSHEEAVTFLSAGLVKWNGVIAVVKSGRECPDRRDWELRISFVPQIAEQVPIEEHPEIEAIRKMHGAAEDPPTVECPACDRKNPAGEGCECGYYEP